MNTKSTKFFDKIDRKKLNSFLEKDLPENSAILNRENKFVKQYLGYCSIENNFEFSLLAINKLIDIRECEVAIGEDKPIYDDTKFLQKRSLYISVIVNYCKCFSASKGRMSLNRGFVSSSFTSKSSERLRFTKFHDNLKELRNKFVAHADDYHLEHLIAFVQFECSEEKINSRMNYSVVGTYTFDEDEMNMFKSLLTVLLDKLHQKKMLAARKIVEEMPKEEYLEMAYEALADID